MRVPKIQKFTGYTIAEVQLLVPESCSEVFSMAINITGFDVDLISMAANFPSSLYSLFHQSFLGCCAKPD